MKKIKEVICNDCNVQYEIKWDEGLYGDLEVCASCSSKEIVVLNEKVEYDSFYKN